MSDYEKIESTGKAKLLKPGDLILIRTPSSLYEAFRRLGETYYDHMVRFIFPNYPQVTNIIRCVGSGT
jgi:hypothetical protein